jgi:hypothetical protein
MSHNSCRTYRTFDFPNALPGSRTLLTGIRPDGCDHIITGFYNYPEDVLPTASFVYKGDLCGVGKWNILNYPSTPIAEVVQTNLYGPSVVMNSCCQTSYNIVGNYTVEGVTGTIGCLYQGQLDNSGRWTTIVPSTLTTDTVINTICHSTMGNLVVGNYDTNVLAGNAFIFDMSCNTYYSITVPNVTVVSITAYGIWKNSDCEYTICGSYTVVVDNVTTQYAYLVDWSNKTKKFCNWTKFTFDNDPLSIITHFDGISGPSCGNNIYSLTGDYVQGENDPKGFYAVVKRDSCDNSFCKPCWKTLDGPKNSFAVSGNSISCNTVIGVYTNVSDETTVHGYISK